MVRLLGSACVYGQVLKTRRNNRVVRVERRVKIGTASRLNAALLASEDSETLNTSFIERLNLTIRQGSAYFAPALAMPRSWRRPAPRHVELLRCYYNFIRPHRALRFGRETRTPAMQAGLVSQRLALRDIFTAGGLTRRIFVAVVHVSVTVQPTESDESRAVDALLAVGSETGCLINSERCKHLDSSESPVHGAQEGSAYNGHFTSVCYHPLFLFNEHGDCLAATLRPGNVPSADDWDDLLVPELERQQAEGTRVAFRADAAFAKPEIYDTLEQRDKQKHGDHVYLANREQQKYISGPKR